MPKKCSKSLCENTTKDSKYQAKWERTLWETYSYRNPTPDCDTKRSGPCKRSFGEIKS